MRSCLPHKELRSTSRPKKDSIFTLQFENCNFISKTQFVSFFVCLRQNRYHFWFSPSRICQILVFFKIHWQNLRSPNCEGKQCLFWFLKNFPVFFFAIVKINNFPSNSKWVPHFCSFKSILAIQSLALTNFTSRSLSALKESVKYTKNIWRQSILIVHQLLMTYTSSMSIWINSMIWIALSFKGKQGLMHHSQKIGSKKELQPTLSNKLNEVSS